MTAFDVRSGLDASLEPTSHAPTDAPRDSSPRGRSRRTFWSRLRHSRQAVAGLVIIAVAVLVSALAPSLAPHDPNLGDGAIRLVAPGSPGHLLGTDDQGRDLLSRVIYGGRSALFISVVAVAVAMAIGTALGLVAGFAGRRTSGLLMRAIDLMFAFPVILVALSLAATVSPGPWVLIGTIVFGGVPYITRIVYAETGIERDKDYVEAARSLGASELTILRTEVLPNIGSSIIIYGTSLVGVYIVLTASLSALGLGIQPPDADWGRMIFEGAKVLVSGSPAVASFPAAAVLLVALAFNWLGDGLRDVLNP